MNRHYYGDAWRKTSEQRKSSSPYDPSRRRSRSPLRTHTLSNDVFRNHSYESDGRPKELPKRNEIGESASDWTQKTSSRIDFEAERRGIDLEIQRRELERKRREEEEDTRRKNAEIERVRKEVERKERERKSELEAQIAVALSEKEATTGIRQDDLRIMLEQNRTASRNLTPPPQPPSANNIGHISQLPSASTSLSAYPNSTYASGRSDASQPIPGFDRSRLGSSPNRDEAANAPSGSTPLESEDHKEQLVANFTNDCNTVAKVTQMLIDENPALQPALIEAMKGVMQKIMKQHLDGALK